MRTILALKFGLIVVVAGAMGCGSAPPSSTTLEEVSAAHVDGGRFLLTEEPVDAVGVITAHESAENDKPLVMVGRIGGAANPWIDGRAAFMMLDASMTVAIEGEEAEGELCTGDCCAEERLGCTALVKIVDANGSLVPVDSRKLLGVKELDMVVVKGKAQKDEKGNFVMLATGIYVRR